VHAERKAAEDELRRERDANLQARLEAEEMVIAAERRVREEEGERMRILGDRSAVAA
jgi:hypothetical protein